MSNLFLIFTSKKYFAAAQLFLCLSLMFGTWVIYIPSISTQLNLSPGDLGFILLFGAIGSITSLPFGKYAVSKLGEGKLALFSISFHTLAIVGNLFSTSGYMLAAFLFLTGFSSGFVQIGINSIVSTLEKSQSVTIMSSCHGFYSLGGIISSGLGTMLLIAIGNQRIHALLMALIVFGLQIAFAPSYLKLKNESNDDYKPGSFIKTAFGNALLWAFAIVAVSVMVSEGAIADWSGLFLRDVAMTPANFVGLGYAGFSVTMTLGRFMGDFLSKKFGAWKVIISGFSLSIAGFLLVLTAHTLTSIAGFLFIGFGFSTIVPEIYRLSSNIKGVEPSSGIAFMAGAGYVGFLAGPVALGAIAEHHGLTFSFIVLLGLVSLGTSVAFLIKKVKENPKNG